MKIEDLMDLTLREVLETYCAVHNLECGYYYGIFKISDVEKILKEYNVEEDYPEAFCAESLLTDDELRDIDEIRDYNILINIMNNLGISKKENK